MNSSSDIKKFCHGSIIAQDIEKLFSIIKEKIKAGQVTQNIPEVKKLWNNVMHNDHAVVANCSCEVILNLLRDGDLEIETALKTITTLSATLKNVRWMMYLTFKLLKLQYLSTAQLDQDKKIICGKPSYQLHYHTHPLIFIFVSSPQCWNSILAEIQVLFYETTKSDSKLKTNNVLEIFQPFFAYVFLNPSVDESNLFYKVSLLSTLLNVTSYCELTKANVFDDHSSLFTFTLDMLCSIKVTPIHLQLCNTMFTTLKQSSNLINSPVFKTKFAFCLIASCQSLNSLPSSSAFASLLSELLKTGPSINHVCVFLICLSNLLCRSHPDALSHLLQCAIQVMQSCNWSEHDKATQLVCIYSIKAAIMQLLLSKHFIGFNRHLVLLRNCLQLLDKTAISCNQKESSVIKETFTEFSTHDVWLSDALLVFQNLLVYQEEKTLSGLSSVLKFSENIALNTGLVACGILYLDCLNGALPAKVFSSVVGLLTQIISIQPNVSFALLPTILYGIKNASNTSKQKKLLLSLSEFAVDNSCIPPILGAVQSLSQVKSLLPTAIHLMMKLWKKKDRCFPYLHKMLSQAISLCSSSNLEVTMVIVLVLKELCAYKKFQNTSEVLAMISTLLKKRLHPGQVVLILDGIYCILSRQLVNIQSMWKDMLKDISYSYQNVSVTKSVLKTLSLVQKYEVESPSFVQFKKDILKWVWLHLENTCDEVKGAMLVSLAHFKKEDLLVIDLPLRLQPPRSEEMTDEEFSSLPLSGEDFIKVLDIIQVPVQMQYFCESLLSQELQDMPRDIKDRAFRAQKQNSQPKVLDDFSNFVMKIYEKNKQPNFKASFATSVLMCYNPSLEESPKTLVSLSRDVLHLLQSLLGEVTADGKNWKALIWIVHAWKVFMQKCFKVMIKGRVSELNMQLQKKDADKEDITHKLKTVSYWCRDKITELLKTTSKGTPTMQGNSFLALGGLFTALHSSKNVQDDNNQVEPENCGYLSSDHWLGMAADTIISAADSNYKPVKRIFSWCQYKSVSRTGRLTTSKFGEVCALQAVRIIFPIMVPHDMDRIKNILSLLHSRVNVNHDQHVTPVITLHLNLVLGSLASYLYQKKMNESSDALLKETLKLTAEVLTSRVASLLTSNLKTDDDIDDEDDYNSDDDSEEELIISFLSIADLLPVLLSSNTDLKETSINICHTLIKCLENLEDKSGSYLEAFYFTFVPACIAGKDCKTINDKTFSNLLSKLKEACLRNKNIPTSVAVTHLCFVLKGLGDQQATSLWKDLFTEFLQQASKQRLPTRQKLATLNGLVALLGSEMMFSGNFSQLTEKAETDIKIVVKLLKEFIQQSRDSAIVSNSTILLGHLYLSVQSLSLQQSSSMPRSYSYLPKFSVLKEMYKVLLAIDNNENFQSNSTATAVLQSLAAIAWSAEKSLPPVDWEIPLSKLLEFQLNKNDETSCIKLALSQASENETAAAVLSNSIMPSMFESFCISSQCLILRNLHIVIQNTPYSNVMALLTCIQSVFSKSNLGFRQAFLNGMLFTLQLSSLNEKIASSLFSFLKQIINENKFNLNDSQLVNQWKKITSCIAEYPDKTLFNIRNDENHLVKTCFIRCELLTLGHGSWTWLNETLQICCRSKNEKSRQDCLFLVYKCLNNLSPSSQQKKSLETWIQEQLGSLMRSSADQSSDIFCLQVLVVCMMNFCKLNLIEIHQGKSVDQDNADSINGSLLLWNLCLSLLPKVVKMFLTKNSNEAMSHQVVDLLLHLYQNSLQDNQTIRDSLLLVFNELTYLPTFEETSVWVKVANVLFL